MYRPFQDRKIKHFREITSNIGDHFHPNSGTFTAPCSGLYAAFLKMVQMHEGSVVLHIMIKKNEYSFGGGSEECVAVVETVSDNDESCTLVVVFMNKGDELYVKVDEVEQRPRLGCSTTFSCFLIG